MSNDGPGATGTLTATPLDALLIYVLDRKLSGSLVFETNAGEKSAIALEAGAVINTRLGVARHRLGEVCRELGLLTSDALARAVARADGRLFGELLREEGVSESDLDRALKAQTLLQVEAMASLAPDTVYGYYAGRNFLERWGAARPRVDPLQLIWRAARSAPPARARESVSRLRALPVLRLHRHSRVGRFGFSAKETSLLDALRTKPQSYDELVRFGLLEPDSLARLLHVLALTRHLDLGSEAMPLGVDSANLRSPRGQITSSPSQPAVRVESLPPVDLGNQRRQEIQALYQALDTATYYELLGVAPDADANAIQGGFFQLARRWHPDRLPRELADCADQVTRIFAKITEAHKVLSSPTQRAEYDRLSREGKVDEDEQAKVQQVLRAVTAFQKAEVLARRGDWAGAEKLVAQAHGDDAEQAEYAALLAYARSKLGRHAADYSDLLSMLNSAVEREPMNMRVKLYRAQVLKQAGKTNDAMRDFRTIVEAEPGNVEAQRELRLYKMRKTDPGDENKAQQGGLLGRLFRKD